MEHLTHHQKRSSFGANPEFTYIDDTRTIRAHESCLTLPNQSVFNPNHVLLGNTFSNANN